MTEPGVRTLVEQDEHNFKEVWRTLGSKADLPDEVARLYTRLQTALQKHLPIEVKTSTPQDRHANMLYLGCYKHLIVGAASLFRLHSGQMFRETRAAVEGAALARAIRSDAEIFEKYRIDDALNREARRNASKALSGRQLFPPDIPAMAELKTYFDFNSTFAHANYPAIERHLVAGAPGNQHGVFHFQDIQDDGAVVQLTALTCWLCSAHLSILNAAGVVFAGIPVDLTEFNREGEYVSGRVQRVAQRMMAEFPVQPEAGEGTT